MRKENFWLDGIDANQVGIGLQKEIEFSAAEPDVQKITVPGRSGELVYVNGGYKNIKGTAKCYALDAANVSRIVAAQNAWLLKSAAYRRLETLSEPEVFRMARLVRGANLEPRLNRMNPFTLEFDCQPQRYLKSGERPVTLTGSSSLHNPTPFTALPLITIFGSGSGVLSINGVSTTIDDCNGVTLDSERHRAYKSGENKTGAVHGDWPVLGEGENVISLGGGIDSVTIIPRWWTL